MVVFATVPPFRRHYGFKEWEAVRAERQQTGVAAGGGGLSGAAVADFPGEGRLSVVGE
jgi:hypothetical protein